jgi:hypothetical protein
MVCVRSVFRNKCMWSGGYILRNSNADRETEDAFALTVYATLSLYPASSLELYVHDLTADGFLQRQTV